MAEESKTSPPAPNPNVASAPEPVNADDSGRVRAEDYESTGNVQIRAKRGYEVNPTDLSLPVITHSTVVTMSKAQADALMDEAGEFLVRTDTKE